MIVNRAIILAVILVSFAGGDIAGGLQVLAPQRVRVSSNVVVKLLLKESESGVLERVARTTCSRHGDVICSDQQGRRCNRREADLWTTCISAARNRRCKTVEVQTLFAKWGAYRDGDPGLGELHSCRQLERASNSSRSQRSSPLCIPAKRSSSSHLFKPPID